MSYTPSTGFTLSGVYTPSTAFDFNSFVVGALSVTTDDAVAGFVGSIGLIGNFACSTDDATASFVGSVGLSGNFAGRTDDAAASFVGSVGLMGNFAVSTDDATASFSGYVSLTGSLAASTDDATALFSGKNITNLGILSVITDDAIAVFSGMYDSNVHRYTTGSSVSVQQHATQSAAQVALPCEQTIQAPLNTASPQQQAAQLNYTTDVVVESTRLTCVDFAAVVERGALMADAFESAVDQLTPINFDFSGVFEQGAPLADAWTAAFNVLEFVHTESAHMVDDSSVTIRAFTRRIYSEPPARYRYVPILNFALQNNDSYSPDDPFVWPYVVPFIDLMDTQQRGVIRLDTDSSFQRATPMGLELCSTVQDAKQPWTGGSGTWNPGNVYPPNPPPVDPPGHVTLTIPTRSAYIMQHVLSVTLLDLTPISMESVNLGLDADSFSWQFRGTLLDKADLVKVQQVGSQAPVQLIVTVNGYSWRVLVERIERSRKFAENNITLSGRGLTALLGQPYEQPASATQSADLTVQQLAELQCPVGWSINWTSPTWGVPSGAYSYNSQTPIQALAALVSDIGAMMVPSRNAQIINIMPRYPILPWHFNLVSPDLVVPEEAILSVTMQSVTPYQANGVYVHGTEIGGVLSWCRLDGTDGARLSSTMSNALMTDVVGCRALGERIIAGQYQQPAIQSITLPLDGVDFPLAEVGALVEIFMDNTSIRGIINSVQIDASLSSVRQTIQIGEESPNTWAMFKELLPRDPLLVATLASTDGTTSLMTLLDNGVVRVRGTGTVGGKYYIRSGRIDGEAPAMVQNEVVI
ncbi:MAG: hypothetical protein ACXWT1_05900 [Methylobacter sp.]